MLRFPHDTFRLLYWIFFKPFTLRRYVKKIDDRLDQDLKLWEAKDKWNENEELRELTKIVWALLAVAPITITAIVGFALQFFVVPFEWFYYIDRGFQYKVFNLITIEGNLYGALPYLVGFTLGALADHGLRWKKPSDSINFSLLIFLTGGGHPICNTFIFRF